MDVENLEIFRIARKVSIEIHRMTLMELPKFEMYETGAQIRRSSKSIRSNIVEGYSRRCYKGEWNKFLIYAKSSNDETIDHLNILWETKSLQNEIVYQVLKTDLESLGKMLTRFRQAVNKR